MDISKDGEEEEEKQVGENVEEEKNGLVVILWSTTTKGSHPSLPPLRYLLVVFGRCVMVALLFHDDHDDPFSGKRTVVVGTKALSMVLVLSIALAFVKEADAESFFVIIRRSSKMNLG
jgi:hypothetical protein